MSEPLVTIITPTYNRPALFAECAQAVLAQRFTDWVWWVVLNFNLDDIRGPVAYSLIKNIWKDHRVMSIYFPVNQPARDAYHLPAQIVNWLYPKVQTPYIYFLADDDLIDPDGLAVLVDDIGWGAFGSVRDVVYGRCEVVDQQTDGTYKHGCWCYEDGDVGLDTGIDPHCRLDGGQVLHTKRLWEMATQDGWKLTDSKEDASANDGTLLNRLAQFSRFHYVPQRIVTHRRHAGATHHKPQLEAK